MKLTPPFYLSGEPGRALNTATLTFSTLGVQSAEVTWRSLDADELTFSIRRSQAEVLPDDGQWISLLDDSGKLLFRGIVKRSFSMPERVYHFVAFNAWEGLRQTAITDAGRPLLNYDSADLGSTLKDLFRRAENAGLPVRLGNVPTMFEVPKMGFRSTSFSDAILDVLKWVPDVTSRADYETTRAATTFHFFRRISTASKTVDLDSETHRDTHIAVTPYPELRAEAISFAYARREGEVIRYLTQSAGNDAAEARKKMSIYLSGIDRSDLLVSEALATAEDAIRMVKEVATAAGVSVDARASTSRFERTWENFSTVVPALQAAVAAEPGFTMFIANGIYSLFPSVGTNKVYYTPVQMALVESNGAPAMGWYDVKADAFSPEELAVAKATIRDLTLRVELVHRRENSAIRTAGENAIISADPSHCNGISGHVSSSSTYPNGSTYVSWLFYQFDLTVKAVNVAPSVIAARVKADIEGGNSALVTRADFVEAPPNLAQNFFDAQDWLPHKGTLKFAPASTDILVPGEYLSVQGDDIEPTWLTMRAPIAETRLDLEDRVATTVIGPPAAQDITSLLDRLQIPERDNYQAG